MTGPICFVRNDLPIELKHMVVAPGVPKSGRNGILGELFAHLSTDVRGPGWNP